MSDSCYLLPLSPTHTETESTRLEVKDSVCLQPTNTTTTPSNLSVSMSSLVTRQHQNGYVSSSTSTQRQGGSSPLLDRQQQQQHHLTPHIKRSSSGESSASVAINANRNGSGSSSGGGKKAKHNNHHHHSSSGNGAQALMHPSYSTRVLKNKKRVVKMLCVVVLEYFVCWTPLFLLNSWTVMDYLSARVHFTPLLKSAILLLAYTSSCVHPITYCFMNRRFRQSFADAFRCCFRQKLGAHTVLYSEASHAVPQGGAAGGGQGQVVNGRAGIMGTNNRNFRITWKKT